MLHRPKTNKRRYTVLWVFHSSKSYAFAMHALGALLAERKQYECFTSDAIFHRG